MSVETGITLILFSPVSAQTLLLVSVFGHGTLGHSQSVARVALQGDDR